MLSDQLTEFVERDGVCVEIELHEVYSMMKVSRQFCKCCMPVDHVNAEDLGAGVE